MMLDFMPPRPVNPFSAACAKLRANGYVLSPSDIPGLTDIRGPNWFGGELTMNQIVDLANQLPN